MARKASEGDYPSQDDHSPSLDDGSNDTTEGSASSHSPTPEIGSPPGDGATMTQLMKSDHCEKPKTSDKKTILEPESNCMRKTLKITSLDPNVFRRICNLLNIPRVLGGDWRSLAGKLDYTVLDINIFEQTKNIHGPTGCFLQQWDSSQDNFAEEIIKILKEMNRDDVVMVLEAEIKRKCKDCNCENCGNIR